MARRARLAHPHELRPVYQTSEACLRGHVQVFVLAYALVRIIEDRLEAAGIDMNADEALSARHTIQRATITPAPGPPGPAEQASILSALKVDTDNTPRG